MTNVQSIEIEGKRFVLVPAAEYERLRRGSPRAKAHGSGMPPLPPADADGARPAADFLAVSIARDVIRERQALGLSQAQLARLAGVRQETVCRLETGKHSPVARTVEKIERALATARRTAAKRA